MKEEEMMLDYNRTDITIENYTVWSVPKQSISGIQMYTNNPAISDIDPRYNYSGFVMFNTSLNNTDLEIHLSGESLAGLIVLYTLTTLFSVTGNIFAVLVFTMGRHSRTDLRHFLVNLAVADLVMAMFCMPFTFADVILNEWIFSEPMCTVVLFVQLLAVTASVLTNTAIGIDRFLAVSFPFHLRVTYSRKKYVISVIWICAFSLASVQFFVGRAVDIGDGTLKCIENWEDPKSRRMYTISILLFTYIIPLLILTVTYSIVGIVLWKRTAPGNEDYARDRQRLKSKIKVRHFVSRCIYNAKMF